MSKEVSVVIPCFNEERNLLVNVRKVRQYLTENFENFEIILVDDGSRDETWQEMQKVSQEFPVVLLQNQQNEGKGAAVKKGMLGSRFDPVMFLDADLAIPIEELKKFVLEIEKGQAVVVASRFVPGLKIIEPVLWYRKIMENVFRLLRMLIINNWKIKDTQCGFKVFSRSAAQRIFSQLTVKRFSFDAEALFIAKKLGLRVKELPITLQNPKESHIRLYRDSVNMLTDLFRIRANDFAGKYSPK